MTTTVTITGTGVPFPSPNRAGAGVLIEHDDIRLQIDAGRGTTMRLAQAGVGSHQLSALLVTHLHSDHVTDLFDLLHTRWVQDHVHGSGPLPLVLSSARAEEFVRRLLHAYEYDVKVRADHVQNTPLTLDLHRFEAPEQPTVVWASEDGSVEVSSIGVRHEPVSDAVGYRVSTPDGIAVISGDTRVCDEVAALTRGADVLVHEACRTSALASTVRGTRFETIFSYHADTEALGRMAEEAGVPHLVLTHLIPPPGSPEEERAFADDVRRGGYSGKITVARDLLAVSLPDREVKSSQTTQQGEVEQFADLVERASRN